MTGEDLYMYRCKKTCLKSLNGPDFYVVGDMVLLKINDWPSINLENWEFIQKVQLPVGSEK